MYRRIGVNRKSGFVGGRRSRHGSYRYTLFHYRIMICFSTLGSLLAGRFSSEAHSQVKCLSAREETLNTESQVRRFVAVKVGIVAEGERTFPSISFDQDFSRHSLALDPQFLNQTVYGLDNTPDTERSKRRFFVEARA